MAYVVACHSGQNTQKQGAEKSPKVTNAMRNDKGVLSKNGITLTPVSSPDFPDARLAPRIPLGGSKLPSGKIGFEFDVKNYELGNQTPDAEQKMCANAAKGQHIHHILNGEPYTAHYTPTFEKELKDGNYVSLAFLSRSYHESIKHKSAYTLNQFSVGKGESKPVESAALKQPLLFYSRPKGDYIGEKEISKVLLDFYLVNTTLSPKGNRVRATVNGTAFLIDQWQPYLMEGLLEGENTIQLELIDKDGHLIEGLYNSTTRKINLYKQEPIKNQK